MTDREYALHCKAKINAYRDALRCDGQPVPYSGIKPVDKKVDEAIRLVNQARCLLELAAEEIAT